MISQEQSHALLADEDRRGSEENYSPSPRSHPRPKGWASFGRIATLPTLLAASNLILLGLLLSSWRAPACQTTVPEAQFIDRSPYAGLSRQPSFKFPYSTGYGPKEVLNHSRADELWEAIDIDSGIVAVDLKWAEEQNLAETQPFPWDTSKGLYVVNAFHSVHCLKIMHRVAYEAHHGRPLSREIEHVMHCIDHMRKDAMCNADDFLLPTPPDRQGNEGPRGQNRVCRNWDALVEWTHQHDACYEHITDDEVGFARDRHEIERYFNCPPGSPYAEAAQRYIDAKGDQLGLKKTLRPEAAVE